MTDLHQEQLVDKGVLTYATIHMQDKESILKTKFLIGADGVDSTVRRLLNIPSKVVDYQQTAIVTRTSLNRSHQDIAYERFTKDGAIAMLPLGKNEVATIWTASNLQGRRITEVTDAEFVANCSRNLVIV